MDKDISCKASHNLYKRGKDQGNYGQYPLINNMKMESDHEKLCSPVVFGDEDLGMCSKINLGNIEKVKGVHNNHLNFLKLLKNDSVDTQKLTKLTKLMQLPQLSRLRFSRKNTPPWRIWSSSL